MADVPELELLGGLRFITFDLAKFLYVISSFVMHHTALCSSLAAYDCAEIISWNKLETD